jgi:hypothetical protein
MIQGELIKGTLPLAIVATLYIPIAFVFIIEHPDFPPTMSEEEKGYVKT